MGRPFKFVEPIEKMSDKNENSPFHRINFRPFIFILPLILLLLCGIVSPVNAAETMRATKSGLKVATRNLKPVNFKFLVKSAEELKKLDINPMDWLAFTSIPKTNTRILIKYKF